MHTAVPEVMCPEQFEFAVVNYKTLLNVDGFTSVHMR